MTKQLQARWLAEILLMRNTFPQFEPFVRDGLLGGSLGFVGGLKGMTGKIYEVELRAGASQFPSAAPKIYIRPRVGPNWYVDGTLCITRPWRPSQDTFAQQVPYVAKYLNLHG
jgi:hypothetical protein